jgi:hypothetical protein
LAQFAVDNVEIRPADRAGAHPEQNLPGTRRWLCPFDSAQRLAGAFENHGAHESNL